MKRLIYILILTYCFFGNQKSLTQTITLKSSCESVTEKNKLAKWSDWTDFEKENPTPEIKRTTLNDWTWGNPNYFFEIKKNKNLIKKITIDESELMADIKRENNVFENK